MVLQLEKANLFNSIELAIIIIDREQKVVFWNKGATEVFGYKEEEVLNKEISVLIIPEDVISSEKHAKFVRNFFRGNSVRTLGEDATLRAKTKDGDLIPIEIKLSKVEVEGEYYVVSVVRNISDKTKLIEELKDQYEEVENIRTRLEIANDLLQVEKNDAISKLNREKTQDKLATKMLYSIISIVLITIGLSSFTNLKDSAINLGKDASLLLIGTFGGAVSSVYGMKKNEELNKR